MQGADRELAVCPCGKEGQLHTGLYLQLGRQQVKRSDYSPLFGAREITSGLLCPAFGLPSVNKTLKY